MLLHRIDQASAVDEFALAGGERVPEFRQLFRRHGEVGVEDHEHVCARLREALEHRIGLADPVLHDELEVAVAVVGNDALDLLARSVLAVSLDEDDLLILAKSGNSPHDRLDVSPLVAAGHHDGRGHGSRNGLG